MLFEKSCYTGEFWGAPFTQYEYEVYEEYDGEIYEEVLKMIEEDGMDVIPDTISVKAYRCLNKECDETEEIEVEIDPLEYLTEDEYKKLKEILEKKEIEDA